MKNRSARDRHRSWRRIQSPYCSLELCADRDNSKRGENLVDQKGLPVNFEFLQIIIFICFGGVYCFFGYSFLKFLLVVAGAVTGMVIANIATTTFFNGSTAAYIIIAVVGVIIGVLIAKFLFKAAIWTLGFAFGACLAPLVVPLITDPASTAAMVIAVLFSMVTGFLALFVQRALLILATSTLGAFVVMTSVQLLMDKNYLFSAEDLQVAYDMAVQRMWWAILILTFAGIMFQYRDSNKKKKQRVHTKEADL
jgi:hypothetical protein